ncbi:hypothetical protein [Acidianus sp. RZ1]|uniref:hypothetical protein n=1 Tax=Acidianus sp. RZ1 TaxID=1540082 RepID=UPI0014931B98|nr:hypothetical protein [Acidianus sp. RZ1]NON62708.1 hypothetical protein [Acidianus sp. RZ1]
MTRLEIDGKTYTFENCLVLYGYHDVQNVVNSLQILDTLGYQSIRHRIAWDIYFKISREYSDDIRTLYFTIFEISSIFRELNFRNIDPSYALPSIISNIPISLKLKVENNTIYLSSPIHLSIEADLTKMLMKMIGRRLQDINLPYSSKVTIPLQQLTGIKDFEIILENDYNNNKININLDLKLPLYSRGLKRNFSVEDAKKILIVTANEVNSKSFDMNPIFEDFSVRLIESSIEPALSAIKDILSNESEISEIVYIPALRPFLLNAEESALSQEEIAQLFSDGCVMAINRIREGKMSFKNDNFIRELKVENKSLKYKNNSIVLAPLHVKTISAILLELLAAKDNSLVIIENPEEFLIEEDKNLVVSVLKDFLHKNNDKKLLVITGDHYIEKEIGKICN